MTCGRPLKWRVERTAVVTKGLLTAGGASALVAVGGCSAGQQSAPTVQPAMSRLPVTSPDAAASCARFFALDLLLRRFDVDVVTESTTGATWASLQDYRAGVVAFVNTARQAVRSGGLPNEVLTHASRILTVIGTVDDIINVTSLPVGLTESMMRYGRGIEVICVSAGVPVPRANVDARRHAS